MINGQHYNNGCCFDYGNAEIDSRDDGNGTMETTYFGNATGVVPRPRARPVDHDRPGEQPRRLRQPGQHVQAVRDLPSIDWRFVTGVAKGEPHHWASLGGNAQSGPLATMFDGPRVDATPL